MPEPLVDRDFVEKFFRSVDRPLQYGVYQLFHEWWQKAPQRTIDAYAEQLASLPGALDFLAARHLSAPLSIERLAACAPGTLGHEMRRLASVSCDIFEKLLRDVLPLRGLHGR